MIHTAVYSTTRPPALALSFVIAASAAGCFAEEGYGIAAPPRVSLPGSATGADPGTDTPGASTPGSTPGSMPGADPNIGMMDDAITAMPGTDGTAGAPGSSTDGDVPDPGSDTTDMGDEPVMPPTFDCEGLEVKCEGGRAGEYACSGVDLMGHLSGPAMQGGTGNDIWGWTDPTTGKEYVLMGLTNGAAFVDISDPCRPVHLGHMRTETVDAVWRDLKVYRDHVYIVSESQAHGIQVYDLTQLRDITNPPMTIQPDSVVDTFGSTHNIVMNEESGHAYAVMTNNCASARSFDLSDPANPRDLGCWGTGNRIHDAQCVNYMGPDPEFAGRELCFTGDEGRGMAIYDVTDKSAVTQVAALRYSGANYGHQGWLTEDHRYFLFGDEGDELSSRINTTTYVIDVSAIRDPSIAITFTGPTSAIDHNLFVRGDYAFLSAYTAGLRILDLTNIDGGEVTEAGYFDAFPAHDNTGYNAMWGNYPFFGSGLVVTSGSEGLFILRPDPAFMQ